MSAEIPSPSIPLPGFGLPLNFQPPRNYARFVSSEDPKQGDWGQLFRNALDRDGMDMRLIPLREFTMMRLMNQITDKPGWDTKIFDENIVGKWKSEALSATTTNEDGEIENMDITEKMFQYCVAELRYKSKAFEKTGIMTAYDGDVVKSDTAISNDLKEALKAGAAHLENVPAAQKDWHPGSNELVLDLVHPSLFPVVYGVTRIIKDSVVTLDECLQKCGEGEILPVPTEKEAKSLSQGYYGWRDPNLEPYSRKFQWLPCEVRFFGDTGDVKIVSYINNLHPKTGKSLYEVIEKIIAKAIPLWNRTLGPLSDSSLGDTARIPFDGPEYEEDPDSADEPPQEDGETDDDYDTRVENWQQTLREQGLILPEPGEFVEPADGNDVDILDLQEEFAEKGLQVIVKLANIHLTPEKPEYAGGTWHVEGQLNEHICATALYYYDCSNITESRLAFRQQSSDDTLDISYAQEDHGWLGPVFGCQQNESTVQYIGDVVAKEGRLLTFPNVFQHRVLPFKLEDPTKPGHRKILALFLVDPHIQVISTANVPCQRRDWWGEELVRHDLFPKRLPAEMLKEVVDNVDEFPMSMAEAKRLRVELMEERKAYGAKQDSEFTGKTFSLCEH